MEISDVWVKLGCSGSPTNAAAAAAAEQEWILSVAMKKKPAADRYEMVGRRENKCRYLASSARCRVSECCPCIIVMTRVVS